MDRDDARGLATLLGPGADLLVDCACFSAAQARATWSLPASDDAFFAALLDYAAEDRFLADRGMSSK